MLSLLLMLPISEPKTYDVDICELNTIVSRDGTCATSYFVWWDWGWHPEHGWDFYCRDWRCERDVPKPYGKSQEWNDGRTKKWLRVRHKVYRETFTFFDRELADRKRMPEHERRKFGE